MADSIPDCSPYAPLDADGSPRSFDPTWRTETVRALALAIEAERAFDRLPVLADALEEAGCDDEVLLRHCRECERHEVGCWVLSTVLVARTSQTPDEINRQEDDTPPISSPIFADGFTNSRARPGEPNLLVMGLLCAVCLFLTAVLCAWEFWRARQP